MCFKTGDINEHRRQVSEAWDYAKSIREEREFVEEQVSRSNGKGLSQLNDCDLAFSSRIWEITMSKVSLMQGVIHWLME